jgi:hypothetical protein
MDSSTSKLTNSVSLIISIFLGFTTIYFLFKGYGMSSGGPEEAITTGAYTLGYIIFIVLIQIWFNFKNAQAVCNGSAQNLFSVLMYTFIPNFLVLGSVIALTSAFPGWLSPFSNTFGYLFISCLGLSRKFNALVADNGNALLTKICADHSLVINEMTPDNYEDFMKTLAKKSKNNSQIFKSNYANMPEYNKLYELVVIKDLIAEYIWYVMAGCLTISISSHSIANIQCEYSTEEMKKTAMDLQDQEEEMQANQKKPSLYTVTN